jgi:hypothetical protein
LRAVRLIRSGLVGEIEEGLEYVAAGSGECHLGEVTLL